MVAFRNKWSGRTPRDPNIWIYQESGTFTIVYGITAKIKVLQQTLLVPMPARKFYGIYGIELHVLWSHSVTTGLGDPHGVPTYGYIKKSENKIKMLHQKLFTLMRTRTSSDRYCFKQLWWHSVTNGLGDRHGVQTYEYIKKSEDFPGCSRATAKIKVLHQKRFILMGTRTCSNPYCI